MHFLRKWLFTVLVNSMRRLQAANGKHVENVYSPVRRTGFSAVLHRLKKLILHDLASCVNILRSLETRLRCFDLC